MSTQSRDVQTGQAERSPVTISDDKDFSQTCAQNAYSLQELRKTVLDSKSRKNNDDTEALDFSPNFEIAHEGDDAKPKEPGPGDLGTMAFGKQLLREGKIEDLCKLVKEIGKDNNDDAVGTLQKLLSAELKMEITFPGGGKSVKIRFGDFDENAVDKQQPYTEVIIQPDGSAKAKEFSGKPLDKGTDVDAKAPLVELKKRIEKQSFPHDFPATPSMTQIY